VFIDLAQGQFVVHWRQGSDNLANYFTKHHSPTHHRLMRGRYLLKLHRQSIPMHGGKGVLIHNGSHIPPTDSNPPATFHWPKKPTSNPNVGEFRPSPPMTTTNSN
jgi:hypothetical protein